MNSVTHVAETKVINQRIGEVWRAIKPLDFKFWSSAVTSCRVTNGTALEVGSQREVTYKDGAVQRYQIVGISDINHEISYELINSDPAVHMSAALHTIRLQRVTHDNTTFVQWESEFSSGGDYTAAVVEDSRLKKKEALQDLENFVMELEEDEVVFSHS